MHEVHAHIWKKNIHKINKNVFKCKIKIYHNSICKWMPLTTRFSCSQTGLTISALTHSWTNNMSLFVLSSTWKSVPIFSFWWRTPTNSSLSSLNSAIYFKRKSSLAPTSVCIDAWLYVCVSIFVLISHFSVSTPECWPLLTVYRISEDRECESIFLDSKFGKIPGIQNSSINVLGLNVDFSNVY